MATSDPLMPLSESGKTPQIYQLDDSKNEARYTRDAEAVKVQTPPKFVGLTKEQLEAYRNDPFWKPMRLILFVLFWLAWLGMFAGAIVIVVLSPKCAAKQTKEWYANKVCYQAWTPAFKDSDGDGLGDLKGMNEKLDKLRKIGVQTLWPTPIIKSDAFSYGVTDFTAVDEKLGTLEDFKALVNDVHDKQMYIIMDLPISTTSKEHPWFISSSKGEKEYMNHYVWLDDVPRGGDDQFWSKADGGDRYYLHYQDKQHWPILNWAEPDVKNGIVEAAKFWLNLGVDGFYVGFVEYLKRSNDGTQSQWDESAAHLADFVKEIQNYANTTEALSDKSILLFSSLANGEVDHKISLVNGGLNYVITSELTRIGSESCPNATITPCLHKALRNVLTSHDDNEELHPMWEFGNPTVSRLATRVNDRSTAELLTFIQMLLPGSTNFYYGDEIGMTDLKNTNGEDTAAHKGAMQWDSTNNAGMSTAPKLLVDINDDYKTINFDDQYARTTSPLKVFKKLAKLRLRDETLMMGDYRLGALHEPDAFAFSRILWKGNATVGSVYLGLVNFGDTDKTIDWSGDNLYSPGAKLEKAEVVAVTSNITNYIPRQAIDLKDQTHLIGPKQGIVFRFSS